jgi:hypothetical protein
MAKGILVAAMDFSACREDEFHYGYDLEHVPEHLRIPQRYAAVCHLASSEVPYSGRVGDAIRAVYLPARRGQNRDLRY